MAGSGHERPIDGGLDEFRLSPDSDGIIASQQVTFRADFVAEVR